MWMNRNVQVFILHLVIVFVNGIDSREYLYYNLYLSFKVSSVISPQQPLRHADGLILRSRPCQFRSDVIESSLRCPIPATASACPPPPTRSLWRFLRAWPSLWKLSKFCRLPAAASHCLVKLRSVTESLRSMRGVMARCFEIFVFWLSVFINSLLWKLVFRNLN